MEKPKKPDSASKNTAKAKKSDIVVAQKIAPTKKYQLVRRKLKRMRERSSMLPCAR